MLLRSITLSLLAVWAWGCDSDELFGSGSSSTAAANTPPGVQTGEVSLVYTLTGEDGDLTDANVSYSTDGEIFRTATQGLGGDGTTDLDVSELGSVHTFVWDSQADLPGSRESEVVLRITPDNGVSDRTSAFPLHNARLMVAVEDEDQGQVRLFQLDVADGTVNLLTATGTGGTRPFDVIFENGYFMISHSSSNDVSVLKLDEENDTLTPVENSPFRTDGIGTRHLATDGTRLFVSNTASQSLSIFDIDSSEGTLSTNTFSNVSALGCGAIITRSNRLYVASEANDQILIYDIGAGGELFVNSASPVATGGLDAPVSFALFGTFLYVGNRDVASVSGFSIQSNGALADLSGSPFAASGAGIEWLTMNGSALLAVRGDAELVLSFTTDVLGTVAETATSPLTLDGPSFNVVSAGSVVVVGTTTSEKLHVYTLTIAGELNEVSASPVDAGGKILRMALSD